MKTKMNLKKAAGVALASTAAVAGAAFADTGAPDTSAIVTVIGYAVAAIATIGSAVVAMKYGAKLWTWISPRG